MTSASASRRGSTPPGVSTAPTPASSCSSPTTPGAPRRSPPSSTGSTTSAARPSARSRRAPRLRCASSRGSARGTGTGDRREGLAPGGGRDRRLAPRRTPLAPGDPSLLRRRGPRARVGPQHPRLRPARWAAGVRRAPDRFGGHRAAAGLELDATAPGRLSRRLRRPCPRAPRPGGAARSERIDALVGGDGLGLELAEELQQLGPFGAGNPGVQLLVPSARVATSPMGDGKHSRFSLRSGGARALGVAFGRSSLPRDRRRAPSTPPCGWRSTSGTARSSRAWCCASSTRSTPEARPTGSRCRPLPARTRSGGGASRPSSALRWGASRSGPRRPPSGGERRRCGRAPRSRPWPSWSPAASRCSPSAPMRSRRAELAAGAAGLSRFGGGTATVACGRCGDERGGALAERRGALPWPTSPLWSSHPRRPAASITSCSSTRRLRPDCSALAALGPGEGASYLHSAWGEQERGFAMRVLEEELGMRRPLRAVFRGLHKAGAREGEELRDALAGSGEHLQGPELAARCVRVLDELELIVWHAAVANAASGSYPRSTPIWAARARFAPTAPASRRARNTSQAETAVKARQPPSPRAVGRAAPAMAAAPRRTAAATPRSAHPPRPDRRRPRTGLASGSAPSSAGFSATSSP